VRVQKRDGSYQELQMTKIQRALLMAFQGQREQPDVMPLVKRAVDWLRPEGDVSVGRVSDVVESVLIEAGHARVARGFMRHRMERDAARAERLRPDTQMLKDYIHVAKYARHVVDHRESRDETIDRVEGMHTRRWPEWAEEIGDAFDYVRRSEGVPSMRSMQFAGEAMERDNARGYNCSFTHVNRWAAFQETLYLLLCGCGVGYSVQWRHIEQLGDVIDVDEGNVCHYTIADDIKGWADALGFLIQCYTKTGCWVEFNYSLIRAEGSVLKTSGGRAPGHLPLKRMLEAVRGVLHSAQGRRLRPVEAHDILCYEAQCVLAGGIRRSAMIALFSPEDTEMLCCKTKGVFRPMSGGDPGLNAQREMANNSACLLRGGTSRAVFERIIRVAQANYGDPGFYWTTNLDYGPNPCGEIGMWPMVRWCDKCGTYGHPGRYQCGCGSLKTVVQTGWSFCNLTEVNCQGADEEALVARVRAMARIGTMQASYTGFSYLGAVSEAICKREALLGVGLTGIMDNPLALDARVLQRLAAVAVRENKVWASRLGINTAARVTTVKPSGTASLWLGGVGSGIHPRWARRYIQRVTANPNEPAAQWFYKTNPHMVEVKPNGDWCLMFPIQCDDDAVTVKEQGWGAFMDAVFTVYENWIKPGTVDAGSAPGLTHNVSCTVTMRNGELDAIVDRLWREQYSICAMSFAPYMVDARFRYVPRDATFAEETWNRLIRLYRPVDWSRFVEAVDNTAHNLEAACASGVCEI